jgi:hypothetical protein
MKILLLMDSPEYLRFFDVVIEELAGRGHEVSLAVGWERERKHVGLEGLRSHIPGVRVVGVAPQAEGMWADVAYRYRGVMDFVRYLHPAFAHATALRDRMKQKVLPSLYRWIDLIPQVSPGTVERVERTLMVGERAIPLQQPIVEFLRREAPDVLFLSPLVAAGSPQVDWIKAARTCGIRTAVGIASWDNLTNKGLIRVEPDLVIVWNEAQKREAVEYHYIPPDRVLATGAQPFDRWFTKRITRDREAFCARVGLPDTTPFVLFTGSSVFISRSNVEVGFVRRWIAALRGSGNPLLERVNILMRPHPYNFHAWAVDQLTDLPGVSVFPAQSYNMIDEANRADFFDNLYHCAAVVGVNTSAMVEAAILGKPVLSMLSAEFSGTQEGTIHFHHLLPENGGFLRIASNLDEHVQQLATQLADPERARAETSRFVQNFLRPHGLDQPATPLFVKALEDLAAQPAPSAKSEPTWLIALRPVILAASVPQAIATWWKQWRKEAGWPGRRVVKRVRRVAKSARQARKDLSRAGRDASSRLRRRAKLAGKQWLNLVVKPPRPRRD